MAHYKQAVRQAGARTAAALLVTAEPPTLDGWYGDPLAPPAAAALCARAQRKLQSRLSAGGERFPLYLTQLICHFMMGVPTRVEFARLGVQARNDRDAALLHLCYGQLLVSRKLRPALRHLACGFSLAVPYLEPTQYLALVRRHETLSALCLAESPSLPGTLQSLLVEAAVIRRLRQNDRGRVRCTHADTVG